MIAQSMNPLPVDDIARHVRTIPDFPKPGIQFKDICPLLANPEARRGLIELMAHEVKKSGAQCVAGIESRGFIIGALIAEELGLPFVPVRKVGKLPGDVVRHKYDLEYGSAEIEIQKDAFAPGTKIALVDDLLATGGTASAAAKLIGDLKGQVTGCFFAIELPVLSGRKLLSNYSVNAQMKM